MNVMPVKNVITNVGKVAEKNSPVILAVVGVGAMTGGAILAVKSTPRAIELLDQKANRKYVEHLGEFGDSDYRTYEEWLGVSEDTHLVQPSLYFDVLTPMDVIKSTWKLYAPSVGLEILGIVCIALSVRVSSARNAAFAGAASIAEKALYDYQQKVVDILGEEKTNEIRDQIAQDHIKEIDIHDSGAENVVTCSRGVGNTWIYDPITDRKWKSDLETVRSAMNDFNHDLIGGIYGSLNDWYYCLGIKGSRIGDDIGWCSDKLLDIRFAAMVLDNGEPAIVLDYETLPTVMYKYGM